MKHRQVWAWALYDWANSAFATAVMAGFFPVFFKSYWSAEVSAAESTFRLGLANSTASVVIMIVAPLVGAVADRGGLKKRLLVAFALLGIVTTAGLYLVGAGRWELAVILYILALIGFSGGNLLYDALLKEVAGAEELHRVSALGFALGYLGGGVLFALAVVMTLTPASFGLASDSQAVRVSFLLVAGWWTLFTVPLLIFVPENRPLSGSLGGAVSGGWHQLRHTFRQVRQLRVVGLFLLAYWFYIDGVGTVMRMAVDYGLAIGLPHQSLIVALLMTQFVGFPAALVFGRLADRLGAKTGLFIALGVYGGVCLWAVALDSEMEFYGLAIMVGLVQGGVQSLSRSLYAGIIPAGKSGEFFGFYNLLGKFAAVIGPILMGWVAMITGSNRLAILSIVVLFVLGGALLYFVDEAEGRRAARALA